MENIIEKLGPKFGVLSESDTAQLKVMARNEDVAVGDLFILPSTRGVERFYIFRTSQYANVLNRTISMEDVARSKLTMPDSYLSDDLNDEKLIELRGMLLGYAQREDDGKWGFHRPRRLPEHLTDVFLIDESNDGVVRELLSSQLGEKGIFMGYLLAGEKALSDVPVYMPPHAISHHIGIFGRTGCGKSNLMIVLIESMFRYNQEIESAGSGQKVSMLAIDPHDEFCKWPSGDRGGIEEITGKYGPGEWDGLAAPFYYLTAKDSVSERGQQTISLSRADIVPQDLFSIMEFSEQQIAFAHQFYSRHGEMWITRLLAGEVNEEEGGMEGAQFLPGTISAVERRVNFLRRGQTSVFTPFDPEFKDEYNSLLPEIVCALESGRIITVDTTLMNEMEQFLLTTVIARTLFMLRKAVKSANSIGSLEREISLSLGHDPDNRATGMQSFAGAMIDALNSGKLPYIKGERPARVDELPFINVVIEEAPSVLNPDRLRFGSIFRDISRQGRKFGIGLTVISQQVSAIDQGILTQLNTEITLALGNEAERREAIRNASADLYGFEKELQVMGKGQAILTASYKDVPLPVQVPLFEEMGFPSKSFKKR